MCCTVSISIWYLRVSYRITIIPIIVITARNCYTTPQINWCFFPSAIRFFCTWERLSRNFARNRFECIKTMVYSYCICFWSKLNELILQNKLFWQKKNVRQDQFFLLKIKILTPKSTFFSKKVKKFNENLWYSVNIFDQIIITDHRSDDNRFSFYTNVTRSVCTASIRIQLFTDMHKMCNSARTHILDLYKQINCAYSK